MSHTVTLKLADDIFEPIASGAAQNGVTVEAWIEGRLRVDLRTSDSSSDSDDLSRKESLISRARQIMDRVRERNAHLSEEEIAKIVDDAVTEVRQRG